MSTNWMFMFIFLNDDYVTIEMNTNEKYEKQAFAKYEKQDYVTCVTRMTSPIENYNFEY